MRISSLVVSIILFACSSFNVFNCELVRYAASYEYLVSNDTVAIQIKDIFKDIIEYDTIKKDLFCIDSLAQPLTISGFGDITDLELRRKIRLSEMKSLPHLIKMLSYCGDQAKFNLSFSVVNKNYLTAEISVAFLNPFGGSSKGPSIKFLFEFDENDNTIHKVRRQIYING